MKSGFNNHTSIRENRSNGIEGLILTALKDSKTPLSTLQISKQVEKSWHTVNSRCLNLQLEGKVTVFKAGNITLWSVKNEK